MGSFSATVPACLVSYLVFLAFCCKHARGSSTPPALCPKYSLQDTVSTREDQCLYDENQGSEDFGGVTSRVSEMSATNLEKALSMLQSRNDPYVAVLFYADWCPFSKIVRPIFDTLSSSFPAIYHFAVESSALWPSALSPYGVHSFPALVLHNKTVRAQYYGSRTTESIGRFYKEITGLEPIIPVNIGGDGMALINKTWTNAVLQSRDNHHISWSDLLKRWLHDDLYLVFATVFLLLRLVFYLWPKIWTGIKYYWVCKETSRQAHNTLLGRAPRLHVETIQSTSGSRQSVKGKSSRKEIMQEYKDTGKGGLSVPGWSSSSLAAVTLAEGSSSRAGTTEDARENGHVYVRHFWG